MLSAYWARGEDVGDREVLERLAEAAGMPAERVVAALDDDLSATAVRLDERRAAKLGIRAVPTFQFGRRFAVSGAQSPAALADAARRAIAGADVASAPGRRAGAAPRAQRDPGPAAAARLWPAALERIIEDERRPCGAP